MGQFRPAPVSCSPWAGHESKPSVRAQSQRVSNKTQWGINQTAGERKKQLNMSQREKRDMGLNINIVSSWAFQTVLTHTALGECSSFPVVPGAVSSDAPLIQENSL